MGVYRAVNKPVVRSAVRIKLGRIYRTLKRYLFWFFGGIKFAKKTENELKYEFFCHETPLLRHLRGIDISLEKNKIINLNIAVQKINNVCIRPGEVFSFWKLIGRTTRRKGYLDGAVLEDGILGGGLGGGLCHLSGFIYWMSLHTPLTVIERHGHGYNTTPNQLFGSDATCFYNYKDLMLKNNTKQSFLLKITVDTQNSLLKGIWLSDAPPEFSYEIYEKESLFYTEDWGGQTRHNLLHRRVFNLEQTQIADEFVAENHAKVMTSQKSDKKENLCNQL